MRLPAPVPRDLRLLPFRAADAVAKGLLTWAVLRGPGWRRLLPGIYVRQDVDMDHRLWCYAAALHVGRHGAVSGLSAALLHGVDLVPDGRPVTVIVPVAIRRPSSMTVTVVRSPLPDADVTSWPGGRVTTPIRTAFDLARDLDRVEAVVALDALSARRLVTLDELAEYAAGHPRWPGRSRSVTAIGLADPGAESPMESRLRLTLVDGGLPRPVVQFEVWIDGRFLGRLDLAYPEWRIGIEYDGDQHRDRDAFASDLYRQNRLAAAGWTILRFTARDVYRAPDRIVALVRSLIPPQ